MADELVVLDGSTFVVSDARGDVDVSGDAGGALGFFYGDMRHLSRWALRVDGEPVRLLTSRTLTYHAARVFATHAEARVGVNPPISIQRDRRVSDGIHEDVSVRNHGIEPRQVRLEVCYGADFADLFEVKGSTPVTKVGRLWTEAVDDGILLWYERDEFRRGTRITFSQAGRVGGTSAVFDVDLGPRQSWEMCIEVHCIVDGDVLGPRSGHGGYPHMQPHMPLTLEEWLERAPALETDSDELHHTYQRSLTDLAALRFRPLPELAWSLPAAGLPWFMALFGRDSLITSYMALPFHPSLAEATLEALTVLQATEDDAYRDAEPGKILHELRRGELAVLGEVPHRPYYGTHDATPLFLILLDEYERWTGNTEMARRLEGAARAALAWIEGPGDPDGDGYLEYRTRSPKGLGNQCWKDSWNSILFADGRLARPPIATCEIQGYAYDARVRGARLAREVWGDEALATRLEADAAKLRERFNVDFWSPERGHYVLALDRDKHQVDALCSNIGHLLWSGIADPEHANAAAASLMSEDMFTGWGVRTMATSNAGYNPIEYHNGTVWPHDTAIVAEGLRRYGFRAEAARLAEALLDAAVTFDYRLPEVFAGFPRTDSEIPVQYPTPASPQAWASAAPLLLLRSVLGLDVDAAGLHVAPDLPESWGAVRLRGVGARSARVVVP